MAMLSQPVKLNEASDLFISNKISYVVTCGFPWVSPFLLRRTLVDLPLPLSIPAVSFQFIYFLTVLQPAAHVVQVVCGLIISS